jgi:competence protein ComEA
VLVGVAVAVLAVAGPRLAHTGAASPPQVAAPIAEVSEAPRKRLVVHVVGAVQRPGLYRLRDGSRIADAVARAGGPGPHAYLAALNLAAPLADGMQIVVPRRLPGAPAVGDPGAGADGGGVAGAKVSLATATAEQLDALPGIGPVTAERIIAFRTEHGPFASVDDLDAVPGVGPARLDQLRELVTP